MLHDPHLLRSIRDAILIAPCAAFLYYLVASACALEFFGRRREQPNGFMPAVSVLKPVRGLDREAYENFASFCRLDYPQYELLFGVSNPDDPAIPVIQRLMCDFPERSIRLFTGVSKVGPNDKASILACLTREARHEVLVMTDSDTRVAGDCLRRIVAPFREPEVGAVTCFYRGVGDETVGDALEAVGITSDFFAGVLVAEQFAGARFALGALMATTRARVEEIGGFEALAEFLLDDFELGHRIAQLGYRVQLLPYAIDMMLPAQSLRSFWQRQLRWSIGVRNTSLWCHLGLLITQGLPLTLLAIAVSRSTREALCYLAAYGVTRSAVGWSAGIWGLRDSVLRRKWWLVPARDAMTFCAWLASIPYSRVRWRGDAFRVRDGRLIPTEAEPGQ
jgi:ceramide glucosyltransferase